MSVLHAHEFGRTYCGAVQDKAFGWSRVTCRRCCELSVERNDIFGYAKARLAELDREQAKPCGYANPMCVDRPCNKQQGHEGQHENFIAGHRYVWPTMTQPPANIPMEPFVDHRDTLLQRWIGFFCDLPPGSLDRLAVVKAQQLVKDTRDAVKKGEAK